jgi:uncharacterized protein (TIGR02266 family)
VPLSPELEASALESARNARKLLADAQSHLRSDANSLLEREAIASAVGFLYECELAQHTRLLDALQLGLSSVAEAMRSIQSGEGRTPTAATVKAQSTLAVVMARLYPSMTAMENALVPGEGPRLTPHSGMRPPPASAASPSVERRRESRHLVAVAVGLTTDTHFYVGQSDDLSTGGLFVATSSPRPVGTKVTLSFVLPSGEQVTTEGVVRWLRKVDGSSVGMGIAFEQLQATHSQAISTFLDIRPPLQPSL